MIKLETCTLEETGISEAAIKECLRSWERHRLPIHSFLIIRHGKMAVEYYCELYTKNTLHRLYSVAKSFVSLAIGCLAEEGRLHLDDSIKEYFPEYLRTPVSPWLKETTIRHMLQMASCHSVTTYKKDLSKNWVESFFQVIIDGIFEHILPVLNRGFVYGKEQVDVLCLLITIVTKHISTPLLTLTGKIIEMKNKNLQAEFDVGGCHEIDILNRELHRMHAYSIELMEEIKQERDLKRKAELTMLQEQIKPHFLYNSLYSIQQLCEIGENGQAAKMIGALSSFYRLGISGGNDIITIEEELKHADHYLQIQKMRYSDRFDYIIDCDPVIYPFEIPKLVLHKKIITLCLPGLP